MAREMFYRQCNLSRRTATGEMRLVTWLPESKGGVDVEPGRSVTIAAHGSKDFDPEPWHVDAVSTMRLPEPKIRETAHRWSGYRAAVDA